MSYNIEQANSGFMSLTSGGVAIGTNAGTFQIASTITYTSNGILRSKSATNNIAFSTGHTNLANSQSCLFALWLNSAGDVSTSQGPIVPTGEPCPVPTAPGPNLTPFALIKVACSSSQTFTVGTTVLNTGNTATFINVSQMPGSAQ
jgi:hypothetical protein